MIKETNYFDKLLDTIDEEVIRSSSEFKDNIFYISSDHISLIDLSDILRIPFNEIISFFWNKGIKLMKNNSINLNYLESYLSSIKVSLKKRESFSYNKIIDIFLKEKKNSLNNENYQTLSRIPLIAIMGHVDHGKTTLFDTISKRNTQLKEAGGITQKVSVFQIKFKDRYINFLDTPGHSDFIRMRKNGLHLSDLVILIINLEEGVKEQTSEIIKHLKDYNLPFLIFANIKRKIDESYKKKMVNNLMIQLQELEIIVSDFGGDKLFIIGNAKDEKDTDYLLDVIQMFHFSESNISIPGNGFVIDSYWDYKKKTKILELLLTDGILKKNEKIFLNGNLQEIKQIDNFFNESIDLVYPGNVIKISGFNFDSELGDKFLVFNDYKNDFFFNLLEEKLVSLKKKNNVLINSDNKNSLNVFLFSDSKNSLEALRNMVEKINSNYSSNFVVSIVGSSINKITNSFLNLIKMTKSVVLIFISKVHGKSDQENSSLLKSENITYFSSKILYELENNLKLFLNSYNKKDEYDNNFSEKINKNIIGKAVVKKSFFSSKIGSIAGCRTLINGEICKKKGGEKVQVDLIRKNNVIFSGNFIKSLEVNNIKVDFVKGSEKEFGIVIENFNDDYKEGDEFSFYVLK